MRYRILTYHDDNVITIEEVDVLPSMDYFNKRVFEKNPIDGIYYEIFSDLKQ